MPPKGGTVLYGGGGAWCRLWSHAPDLVSEFARIHPVIVLPSSYELSYSIPDTTFFRRDRFGSKQTMPGAFFCHDMAFYLRQQVTSKGQGEGRGFFFRVDEESAGQISIPPQNEDVSYTGGHFSEATVFVDRIDRFAVIYTDRLHVTIAACLLGKEVHMYPGGYFKNRDVYRSSVEGRFDNVYFHDEIQALAGDRDGRPAGDEAPPLDGLVFALHPGCELTVLEDRTELRRRRGNPAPGSRTVDAGHAEVYHSPGYDRRLCSVAARDGSVCEREPWEANRRDP